MTNKYPEQYPHTHGQTHETGIASVTPIHGDRNSRPQERKANLPSREVIRNRRIAATILFAVGISVSSNLAAEHLVKPVINKLEEFKDFIEGGKPVLANNELNSPIVTKRPPKMGDFIFVGHDGNMRIGSGTTLNNIGNAACGDVDHSDYINNLVKMNPNATIPESGGKLLAGAVIGKFPANC